MCRTFISSSAQLNVSAGPFIECARLNCIIVASSAFTSSVAFASFMHSCFIEENVIVIVQQKNQNNYFFLALRKSKTLAFICKVLYMGPCCLHVLYRWFHVYVHAHSTHILINWGLGPAQTLFDQHSSI